ncbi:MAG: alcohol dehydrogenase, partial [Bacteroidetes bacterium]|nr:alcohol dehydrogenase [Bacteroidota bacterium]
MHKNFKGIEKTVFGRGSFNQLGDILNEKRNDNDKFMLFIVDDYFKDKELATRIPAQTDDIVEFIDVDVYEPTTEQIDSIRDSVKSLKGIPPAVIGIGGGS